MTEKDERLRGEVSSVMETRFARVFTPFEQFIHDQKTASALLLVCTVIALIVANSSLAGLYDKLVNTHTGLQSRATITP
jgi:NhaA family Na+:H+ antiporter